MLKLIDQIGLQMTISFNGQSLFQLVLLHVLCQILTEVLVLVY